MSNILKGIHIINENSKEIDYDDPKWDQMVKRVGQMAKEGPRKTVWDPVKRVYKTVPVNTPKEKEVDEGEVKQFPKKHRGDLSDIHQCPKCGGDLQSGKYMGHAVKVCQPCKQVYLPPNTGIDQQGNKISEQGVAEEQLDELKCWPGYTRVQGVPAGAPGSCKKKTSESEHKCPHCGGEMVSEELMNEKKDACYYKVKSRYKVWPSAYASGALVKCRKKGAKNWGTKSESSILEGLEQVDENLHKWFKEKWVRFGPDGKIRGDCARGDDSEGKPKCLPQAKAHSLGKKGRKYAAAKKRREDPNPERRGPAKNVATKKKSNEGLAEGWKEKAAAAALAGAMATGASANTPKVPLDQAIRDATAWYNINKAVKKQKEKSKEETPKKTDKEVKEVSDQTKQSYKQKAQAQVRELEPHAKSGEYKDIAQRAIDRRTKGLSRVK